MQIPITPITQLPQIGDGVELYVESPNPIFRFKYFKPEAYAMSVHTNAFALEQAGNPESKVDQNLALFQNSLNTIPLAPEENPNFYLNEGHTILITAVGGSLPDIRIYTPADFQYFEMIGDTLTS